MDAKSSDIQQPEERVDVKKRGFFGRFKRDKADASEIAQSGVSDAAAPTAAQPVIQATGLRAKIQRALARTSSGLGDLFLGAKTIDADLFDELETLLLIADVGVETTTQIIAELTERASRNMLKDGAALQAALHEILVAKLAASQQPLDMDSAEGPFVLLVVGVNGVGKTTLLKLLLGQLEPQQGNIKTGTNLNIAYFDQYRSALNEEKTVQDNLSGGRDMIDVGGKSRHVVSYLRDFLFAPER